MPPAIGAGGARTTSGGAMGDETFSVYGDSISTFAGFTPAANRVYYEGEQCERSGVRDVGDTWWMRVADHFGGTVLANAAFSGCTVEGSMFPAGESVDRARQVLGPGGEQPDAVLVLMGINDYGWGGFRAQVAARSEGGPQDPRLFAAIPASVAGAAPPHAAADFEAAYGRMLANLRGAAPEAAVWCVTLPAGRLEDSPTPTFCHSLRGVELEEYNEAIRRAARANGCRVADVAAFGLDYDAVDGTHPTALGMRQLAWMVCAAMEGAQRVPDDGLFPPCMASARTCDGASCVGCPWARGTGNSWSLVCEKPANRLQGPQDAALRL